MKLSVVIPNYNYSAYVVSAIESVLGQGYPVELIVIDDASTDDSVQRIEKMKGINDFIFIKNPENIGCIRTILKGVELATGDYVHILGSDDTVMPGYYKGAMRLIEKSGAKVFSGEVALRNSATSAIHKRNNMSLDGYYTPRELLSLIRKGNHYLQDIWAGNGLIMSREVLREFTYVPLLAETADWFTNAQAVLKYGFYAYPMIGVQARYSHFSFGNRNALKNKAEKCRYIVANIPVEIRVNFKASGVLARCGARMIFPGNPFLNPYLFMACLRFEIFEKLALIIPERMKKVCRKMFW